MSESLSKVELQALNEAFHILSRNLFTYSAEIGVFSAVTDKDKQISAIRKQALTESLELLDLVTTEIVQEGKLPRIGAYRQIYTQWSYRAEETMLQHYLEETADHHRRMIRVRNSLTSDEESCREDIVLLIERIILSRQSIVEQFNALADGLCKPAELEDAQTSLEGLVKVKSQHHH